ncbi:MAG TPA: nucleotide exchange factor GrpE [Gemmatimonadales bacterium]|nr:nucleotide exchange factor GrpE [Gemmatimonadales bacterium]
MTDSETKDRDLPPPAAEDPLSAAPPPPRPPGALAELPDEAVTRLEGELDAIKDRHLRLAAEFDNFRRRTARERAELTALAQAELVGRVLDALDDLARFAHVDPAATDPKALRDGIDLVERKFWKALTAAGLVRIDQAGVPFDPAVHEAVTTAPASEAAQDHTIGTVLQPGYRLGERLLRPARVLVLTWRGPAGPGDAAA